MLSSCGERNRDFKTVDTVRKKKMQKKKEGKRSDQAMKKV